MSGTDDREPPSGRRGNGGAGTHQPEHSIPKNVPAYNPDPDLITFLERDAKPGEVKVWHPDDTE